MKVLMISNLFHLVSTTLPIFYNAKFKIDVITFDDRLKYSKLITNLDLVQNKQDLINKIISKNLDDYNLIVVCDDESLNDIKNANIAIEDKIKLLPITKIENLEHIYSKIGLSKILQENKINTPNFGVANNLSEAISEAEKIGFPILIKVDKSSGGSNVFECNNIHDIMKIKAEKFNEPTLIQKKIEGELVDLSAFFLDEKLIYFNYSTFETCCYKFGPSVTRKYKQLSEVDIKIFEELSMLAKALGANGFASITCIEKNNERYYFEADMRPNVWFDFGKFIGNNFSTKLENYFTKGITQQVPVAPDNRFEKEIKMVFFLRMKIFDILFNRHNVWNYIPREDFLFSLRSIYYDILIPKSKNFFRKLFSSLNRIPTIILHAIVPQKEHRIKIKKVIKNIFYLTFKRIF